MNCAHDTGLDGSQIVQSLCHRSQAVGSTGSCGNHSILFGQCLMIYIINDSRQIIASRSGDDNFLSACSNMSRCFFFRGVESGTLQNYVHTDLSPGKLRCVCLCIDLNLFSIDNDRIFCCRYGISQCIFALRRIIL